MVKRMFAGAGILFLPFIFELGVDDEMRLPKAKFLAVMAMLYGAWHFFTKVDKALGLLVATVTLSAFFSSTGFPFNDLLLFWGAIVSALWVVRLSDREIGAGLRLFEISATIAAIYSVVQISGLDPFIEYYAWAENWRPTVLFGQHTLYGPYAVTGFLIALFFRHYVVAAILFFPIIVINSSFTFLALGAGLAVWTWTSYRKAIPHVGVALVIIGIGAHLLYPNKVAEGLNDKGRFKLWSQTLQLGQRHPILGHGFGTFKEIYPMFQVPELRKANGLVDEEMSEKTRKFMADANYLRRESGVFLSSHNDILQLFFECGAIAVLITLYMVFRFFRIMATQQWIPYYPLLTAIMAAFLLNSLGSFPFRLVPQALIPLWIYVIVVTRFDTLETQAQGGVRWPKNLSQMNFTVLKTWFSTLPASLGMSRRRAGTESKG